MAEASFGVTYEGPALKGGRMPVRELAPALLSLGELFTEASLTLYPDEDPVALDIQATKDGSFDVDLIVHGAGLAWDQVSDMLTGEGLTTVMVLRDLVIGNAVDTSLFGLIKWLKGRGVDSEEPSVEPGKVRLTAPDGSSLEVPVEVAKLNRNVRVRKKAREVIEPISRDGVRSVRFETESDFSLEIDESEVPHPELEISHTTLFEQETEMVLEIASVAFQAGYKWRLSDGSSTFWAPILDKNFTERVTTSRESFSAGDRLKCKVLVIQSEGEDGQLHTERRILKVLEHKRAGVQPQLPGAEDGDS